MTLFLVCFTTGASFLLSFLLFFHPLHQNRNANRWLSFFVFIIGCAFISTFLILTTTDFSTRLLFKCLNGLQFIMAPSLFISILYFVKPTKVLSQRDWLHFLPFAAYSIAEISSLPGKESISMVSLFAVNKNISFLVRDLLPFQTLIYVVACYLVLRKHEANLKLISSSINDIRLDWLVQFLFILLLTIIIWINDALFELPFLTDATPFVYSASIFFLAFFSIRQKTIFAFKEKDIREISNVLEPDGDAHEHQNEIATSADKGKAKLKRLSDEQAALLWDRLVSLMEVDKIYLDNDLSLPMVAEKLGIGIHETSFLINETTNNNFYNFINKYRIDEAKKLLSSSKIEELNILGIAFASGFNSKTTFNTTFKKIVGTSPSQYSKDQRK